ncbi:MAG: hypothetical protein GX992_01480 [Clostridium sp.]|nr:hypothetical protein [Clostridium sp.]
MDNDFNKKLKQVADMLGGNEKAAENLSGLLSLLAGNSDKKQASPASPTGEKTGDINAAKDAAPPASDKNTQNGRNAPSSFPPPTHSKATEEENRDTLQENIEMMRTVRAVMDTMQNMNDPRINLLTAIRPFLNSDRQKKVKNCIKLFQMTQLTKIMTDYENTI